MPMEPATPTAMPEPAFEPATLPAAPMPTAKMPPVMPAVTPIAPPAVTVEPSISASAEFGSSSVPRLLTANAAPIGIAAAVLCPESANEIATAPAPAMISEPLLAFTVTAPGAAVTVLELSFAVMSASIAFTDPAPAPVAATPLPDCCASAAARAPATVNALMLPVKVASTRSVPFVPLPVSQVMVLGLVLVLDSTSASVVRLILLTAMATPAEIAVALPEPPFAMAKDRLPAMAKMVEVSGPRMWTSLGAGPFFSVRLVSTMWADGPPVIELTDTEPASEPANEPPLLLLLPPAATAPAPPAASLQMSFPFSAVRQKRRSVLSTTKSSNPTFRNVMVQSRTNAVAVLSTPLKLKAPASATALPPASVFENASPPVAATMLTSLRALMVTASAVTL